jgi:hypothetical protein
MMSRARRERVERNIYRRQGAAGRTTSHRVREERRLRATTQSP